MAARRTKRGRRRTRGRFSFLYKLLSAALILAAIVAGCAVFFRVDKIAVEGNVKYTAEAVIQAAEIKQGGNLFALDKFLMSKNLLTRLPYIDEVAIYRQLPDTLVVSITECVPIAAIQGDGAWWILDTKGKILERTDFAGAAALPEVTGLTPTAPSVGVKLAVAPEQSIKLLSMQQLFRSLHTHGIAAGAESFDLTANNEIVMRYAERFTVKLPMTSEKEFNTEIRAVMAAVETPPAATGNWILDLTLSQEEYRLIPAAN